MKSIIKLFSIRAAVVALIGFVFCSCSAPNSNVLVISSPFTSEVEIDSLVSMAGNSGCNVSVVALDDLTAESLDGIRTVVYHRMDTVAIADAEKTAKEVILPFVQNGGNLLLTMDAVRLMNEWGLEPQPIEVKYQDGVDHGFGRPLGFHAYREHPLYEGLFGGAYTWKADFDHQARTLGFHNNDLPKAEGARVLGISWIYIYYLENSKILWETPYGDGKILSIGGHLYFSQKNLNRSTLEIFMDNTFGWLNGTKKFTSKENEWVYDEVQTKEVAFPDYKIKAKTEAAWTPESSSMTGIRPCEYTHFWNVTGQQIAVFGRESGNIEEVWTHPIMGLRDMSFGVKYKGSEEVVWIDSKPAKMFRSPYNLERDFYLDENTTVQEIINASVTEPIFTVNYRWNNPEIEEVYVAYTTNLRLMWPYSLNATGTLYYATDNNGSVTTVYDRTGNLNMVTAFDNEPAEVKGGMYDFKSRDVANFGAVPAKHKSVTFLYRFDAAPGKLNFYMSGGESGLKNSADLIKKYMGNTQRIYAESKTYYDNFDDEFLAIESDDSTFNEAYKWALVSVDKFYTHTPSLGKSMTAGLWSTSRGWGGGHAVSGRPAYVWYFGRDTEFTGLSMIDYGDYEKVKEILITFGKYQDPDGKVYHELTTSGSAHYDASDSTPLYIVLAGYYMKKTGDVEFIKTQWPYIKKALSFCYSTDTDGDGLIENTNVGHGWQEGYELHGAHTEVYLASVWAQALMDVEMMANQFGEPELAASCAKDAADVIRNVNENFWNERIQFYNHGLLIDGSYQEEKCVVSCAPMFFDIADKDKGLTAALNYCGKYYSTDWGVRVCGYNSPYFRLGGYAYGNVWPFHNGCAATAEYRTGLRYQGFRHAYGVLRLYETWDYGNIAEVIMGDKLDYTGIAAHQMWSSSMNLYPLYQGMLGINADAIKGTLALAPAFPVDWSKANVKNIRLGNKKVALDYLRTDDSYTYTLSSVEDVNLDFTMVLPLATEVKAVTVDGNAVEFEVYNDIQNVCVRINPMVLNGKKEVKVEYEGGVGVLLNLRPAVIKMVDNSIKLEQESYDAATKTYSLEIAGVKGYTYDIDVLTISDVKSVSGAELVSKDGNVTKLRVSFPAKGKEPFVDGMIKLQL